MGYCKKHTPRLLFQRKYSTPPPMLFSELMDKYLDETIREDVLKLLDLKMNNPEIAEGKRFDKVNEYIESNIDTIEELIKSLPSTHGNDWGELNKAFLSVLE